MIGSWSRLCRLSLVGVIALVLVFRQSFENRSIELHWLSFSLMIRPVFQEVRTVLHSLTFTGLHAVPLAFRINLRTVMEVVPMAVILNLCTVYSLIGLFCLVLKASVCLDIV